MKNLFAPTLLCGFILIFAGCKKNESGKHQDDANDLVKSARQFFDSAVAGQAQHSPTGMANSSGAVMPSAKVPDWRNAYAMKIGSIEAVIVPLVFDKPFYAKSGPGGDRLCLITDVSRLLVYKDASGQPHAEVATCFPDSGYFSSGRAKFTGIIRAESWQGDLLHAFVYLKDGSVKSLSDMGAVPSVPPVTPASPFNILGATTYEVCYTLEGYNYSPGEESEGYYWTEDEGCEYMSAGDDGGSAGSSSSGTISAAGYSQAATGGGSGGSGISPITQMPITSGDNIIGNIADYDKCFTNVPGNAYSYQVTICVDQPVPRTRDPWGFSATGSSAGGRIINVGHTFLVFTQSSPGSAVTRNTGLYPKDYVTPIAPRDAGQLNNDSQHGYNISLTFTLDNGQFFNMLNYVSTGNSQPYDLNTNNCTSFALHAMSAGGINLITAYGKWAGGGGYDPGDLGEDIRNMPLQAGMARSTQETSHPNLGNCN